MDNLILINKEQFTNLLDNINITLMDIDNMDSNNWSEVKNSIVQLLSESVTSIKH